VILAAQHVAAAFAFFEDARAPVTADISEGTQLAVRTAHRHDLGASDFGGDILAGAGEA
jgi:hypothetical protein